MEVLVTAKRQDKIKQIHIGKEEINLSLFEDVLIMLYFNDATTKLLKLINEFNTNAGFKVKIHKFAFLYIDNNYQNKELKKQSQLQRHKKKRKKKKTRNKFNEEVKDLYFETIRHL